MHCWEQRLSFTFLFSAILNQAVIQEIKKWTFCDGGNDGVYRNLVIFHVVKVQIVLRSLLDVSQRCRDKQDEFVSNVMLLKSANLHQEGMDVKCLGGKTKQTNKQKWKIK